jgi:Uroporphyrinogen decarboxylase (URO-D)
MMTGRDKMMMALDGKTPPGRTPHFELVFFLTMEAFGRVHPSQRHYGQWQQMTETERQLHRRDIADLYIQTARKYEHSAIFFHAPGGWGDQHDDECMRTLEIIRELSGNEFLLMMHGDCTMGLPDGNHMEDLCVRLMEEPEKIKAEQAGAVNWAVKRAERFHQHGALDCWALCSDYCFNVNPFLSPPQFDEFVTPYLAQVTKAYRDMGFYVIKHTDGNIMPILDSLISTKPHALHSLDPQGGVDMAQIKRRVGKQVALVGNVNCALMDTGTDEQVIESTRYALRHGMPGGGYIFSTSNCIYTGMDLRRYDLILDVWRKEGNYPATPAGQ